MTRRHEELSPKLDKHVQQLKERLFAVQQDAFFKNLLQEQNNRFYVKNESGKSQIKDGYPNEDVLEFGTQIDQIDRMIHDLLGDLYGNNRKNALQYARILLTKLDDYNERAKRLQVANNVMNEITTLISSLETFITSEEKRNKNRFYWKSSIGVAIFIASSVLCANTPALDHIADVLSRVASNLSVRFGYAHGQEGAELPDEIFVEDTPTSSITPEFPEIPTPTPSATQTPTIESTKTPEPSLTSTQTGTPTGTPRPPETAETFGECIVKIDPNRPNILQICDASREDGFREPEAPFQFQPRYQMEELAKSFRRMVMNAWQTISRREDSNGDNSLMYKILMGEFVPPYLVTEENRGLGLTVNDLSWLYDPGDIDAPSARVIMGLKGDRYAFRATLSEGVGHIAPAMQELETVYQSYIGDTIKAQAWNTLVRGVVNTSIDQYEVKFEGDRIVDITARKTCRLYEQPELVQTPEDVFTTTGTVFSYGNGYSLETPVAWNETAGTVTGELIVVIDQKKFLDELAIMETVLGRKLTAEEKVNILVGKYLRVVWLENQSRFQNVPANYDANGNEVNIDTSMVELDTAQLVPCGVSVVPTSTPTYEMVTSTATPRPTTEVPPERTSTSTPKLPTDVPQNPTPDTPNPTIVSTQTQVVPPTNPANTHTAIPQNGSIEHKIEKENIFVKSENMGDK